MSLFSNIKRSKQRSGAKADKFSEVASILADLNKYHKELDKRLSVLERIHKTDREYRDAWNRVIFLERHLGLEFVHEPATQEWVPPKTYYRELMAKRGVTDLQPSDSKPRNGDSKAQSGA